MTHYCHVCGKWKKLHQAFKMCDDCLKGFKWHVA